MRRVYLSGLNGEDCRLEIQMTPCINYHSNRTTELEGLLIGFGSTFLRGTGYNSNKLSFVNNLVLGCEYRQYITGS